jgi:peptidylprolyl isomerase
MKNTLAFFSLLPLVGFTGCFMHKKAAPCVPTVVKAPELLKTASGLQYKITTRGCGVLAQKGDLVKVHYTGKLTNDTVFDSSVKRNQPFEFKLGKGQVIKGWDEGIALLHVGDKATFILPPDLGYGAQGAGAIPANSTLVFDVELLDLKPGLKKWVTKGMDTTKTASGLKIIFYPYTKPSAAALAGASDIPVKGDKVKVHYSGFLLDGSLFDSSVERDQPFEFTLGQGMVIKGWDEALALMHKGQKAEIILPYTLAYGERGHPPVIPAKATLVFDVELIDFSK